MPLFLVLFSLFLDHFFVFFRIISLFLYFFVSLLVPFVCLSVLSFVSQKMETSLSFVSSLIFFVFYHFFVSLFLFLCLFPFFLSVCRIIYFAKKYPLFLLLVSLFFYNFFVSLFLCLLPFLPVCLTLCFASQESPSGSRVSEDGRASLLPSFLPRRRRRRRRWA